MKPVSGPAPGAWRECSFETSLVGKVGWLYDGVGISENSWRRGDRISSGVRGSVTESSKGGAVEPPCSSANMESKSVRNMAKTGAGMFKVGAKTMPTFRMLILFTSEFLIIIIRKADSARMRTQFSLGSFCTKILYAATFLDLSSKSANIACQFGIFASNGWNLTEDGDEIKM